MSLPEINKQLSSIPFWNKYELEFVKSKAKIKRLEKNIPLQRVKIQNTPMKNITSISELLPDLGITSYFSNAITKFLIFAVIIITTALCLKSLTLKFLAKWNI